MVKIILEDWQVKNLREYFGHNDKTQTSHWAYEIFNKAYKEQCNIPIVVGQSEQLTCECVGLGNTECNKINDKWICCKCNRPLAG